MSVPGQAVPGTVVPSGSLTTPGGAQGVQGIAGPVSTVPGPTGLASFNLSTTGFTVPAVGATATVTLVDASWATVGAFVYVAGAGGGGQSAILQITAIAGNTLTLLNPASPPVAPPASVGQAGLLNQISGRPTDFVGGDNACHASVSTNTGNLLASGTDSGLYLPPSAISPGLLFLSVATNLTSANNNRYVICSGGSWTLGLPTPAVGLSFRVRNDQGITGTTGTITLLPASGTIDGAASLPLLAAQEVMLATDGTNWRTFGRQRELVIGTQDLSNAAQGVILLPPGYRYYRLLFENVVPVTSTAWLVVQLSSDGGNTWINAAYWGSAIYNNSTTTVIAQNLTGLTSIGLTNGGSQIQAVDLMLWPGDGIRNANWISSSVGLGTTMNSWLNTGLLNTTAIANALRYFMNVGNISVSQLTVKGVV